MAVQESILWFMLIASLSAAAWRVGCILGKAGVARVWLSLAIAAGGMVIASLLPRYPAVAVQVLPASILKYFEGTIGVPFFMFIVGLAWTRATSPRQRRVMAMATALGAVYFVTSGLWMLQSTPASVLAQSRGQQVLQSEEFSCVPAACATVLNRLGVPTSEAQMAELTSTRPGTGATLIRAMDGLERRLKQSSRPRTLRPVLVQPSYQELHALPLPALTPLQWERSRRHMVVIESVGPRGVRVFDPVNGALLLSRREFERAYVGQVIVFGDGGT